MQRLGDNEASGQLLLGGAGQASPGPQSSALRGGGLLKITRNRLRPAASAISSISPIVRPSPGNRYAEQER